MMLVFYVSAIVWRTATVSRVCNGILSISPLVCKAHEVVDCLGLGSSELFPEVPPDKTIPKKHR
jgi:hypothetical protein